MRIYDRDEEQRLHTALATARAEVAQARAEREDWAEIARAGRYHNDEPWPSRALERIAELEAARDNAITNHALLSDDYRNLQQDLSLTRGVLEAAQHRLVAHGCSGKHDMDDCPMCAAEATIATLRAELQAAQAALREVREWHRCPWQHGASVEVLDFTRHAEWIARIDAAAQAHPTPAQEGQ